MKRIGFMRMLAMAGLVAAFAVATGGCTTEKVHSVMRVKAQPVSDFLPDHELLEEQPATFPFHYFYWSDEMPEFEHVYVAPVNIDHLRKSSTWSKFDQQMNGKLGSSMEDLCKFMREAYIQALERSAASNDTPHVVAELGKPKTLALELAIINLVPTKAELNAAGFVGGFFVPGVGLAASLLSRGSITVECRFRDMDSGKIVAMYSDTEGDPTAIVPISTYTWCSTARINMKILARFTAEVLEAGDDYEAVRRQFPVQFISRIKDGELDQKK